MIAHIGLAKQLGVPRSEAADYIKRYFEQYSAGVRNAGDILRPKALWLGIQIERRFGNKDREASLGLFLKNNYPYSKEYLLYKDSE